MSVSELVPKVKNPLVLAPVWNSPIFVGALPALSSYHAQSTSPLGARAATATSVLRAPRVACAVTAATAVLTVTGAMAGGPSGAAPPGAGPRRGDEGDPGPPAPPTPGSQFTPP